MKKIIIVGIGIIACLALCAAVWLWNDEVRDLPAESARTAVTAEIKARSQEMPQIIIPVVASVPEPEPVAESEPVRNVITAEEKTEQAPPAEPTFRAVSKPALVSTEPKPGDRAVIDGKLHILIPGFGWIVDEGGGSDGRQSAVPATNSPATRSVSWEVVRLFTVKATLTSRLVLWVAALSPRICTRTVIKSGLWAVRNPHHMKQPLLLQNSQCRQAMSFISSFNLQ